jgi:exonuclease III
MAKNAASQLKILQWNINGITEKKEELRHTLNSHQIDVALIQETLLKPNKSLYIPGYTQYRNDRVNSRGGGVLLLVKSSLQSTQIPSQRTSNLEVVGAKIRSKTGDIHLWSAYRPPKPPKKTDFDHLTSLLTGRTIVSGDFNAKHIEWGCNSSNKAGSMLLRLQRNKNLTIIAPTTPTHVSSCGSSDILDISVAQNLPPAPLCRPH